MEIKYIAAIVQFTMEELIELAKESARQELGLASTENIEIEITDLPFSKSDLWYPDNSGKWVEVDPKSTKMPFELLGDTTIHILLAEERAENRYQHLIDDADSFCWDTDSSSGTRIVAYKRL